ncbi:band 4.1-like protein 4 isoform X4 [Ictalurus punctatus]|uniref:Erythrocyte membrane protein band 4.1-like 4A n=1 Tax=Ictalurus punctatus TaxID=7998 RepID=A0A979F9S8_ICTPU|nr:band 4.1-like protein 4 isoform X4 [Ictalurus punctatus]
MSCFCSTQEEFYCEVLLLDETKLILTSQHQGLKKSTKGSVVLDYVFSHVNLLESDYFGLRYCDRSHQTYWLDPTKTLAEHKDLIATGPPYTLYFGVKFYAEDPCKLQEEITRYQFFLQIKQDVLQGRIPCPFSVSAQMAALAIQSELGDYDPYKHMPGYVSEYRFVPDQKEDLEEAIEQVHKTLMGQAPSEAEMNYLSMAKTLEMYGVDLHPVFGEKQSEYFLGLTPVGVVVYKNKSQVGKYFWPRITKVFFKETQFELRVLGKDCNETSFFFEAPSKASCKNLWKCCVEHHTFFSGKTAMQMGKDQCVSLPRPNLEVVRTRSKTYPKRSTQPTSLNNGSRSVTKAGNSLGEGQAKASTLPPAKSPKVSKTESVSEDQPSKHMAPWDENAPQSGLYNSASERNKSPKFPNTRRRAPSGGSENEVMNSSRHRKVSSEDPSSKQHRRRSRSRGNTSSGSESENSNREHRKKRNRSRQENEMVDSGPQWEAVLRRQKEKNPNDPNHRRSRQRSRSRSPDVQAKEQLWKHIQKELVDPSGLTEDQLKEIPYKKVETQGDPIRIRHSHSPRSYRQYRRSHCSDGERSVLSEVNSRTDLVPPLPVTRTVDMTGSSTATSQKNGSKDNLSESSGQETKGSVKAAKTSHSSRMKNET